ncbi:hypothetical protein [Streptomyces sp. NPDC101393]|uniref:VG15 protein n=1 Tax=Streptomyces sp. NPDC101393 TaxID=3366141 RepID=UPI003809C1C7
MAWRRINRHDPEATAIDWLVAVLQIVRNGRGRSRRNAIAFYRLYRALETGHTVALPEQSTTTAVITTVGMLRQEWDREVNQIHLPQEGDHREIPVERFEWPEEPTAELEKAARLSLAHTGPVRVAEVVQGAKTRGRLDDPDFLAELESAGRSAANVADREAIRSGRDLVDQASKGDRRVRGWARVTDDDPCHFCSMLASRGAVYRSQQLAGSAGDRESGDPEALKRYHPMCHCQVVPVYSGEAFLTPTARSLYEDWKRVTRMKSGEEAMRAWRQHIERQRHERRNADN